MPILFTLFSENLNYALGWMVVHSLWQATAIAILSGIVSIALRHKAARVRYLIHNAALVAVLMSAAATFGYYYQKDALQTTAIAPEAIANQSLAGVLQNAIASNREASQSENIVSISPNGMRISSPTDAQTGKSTQIDMSKNGVQISETNAPMPNAQSLSIAGLAAYFDQHIYFIVTLWLLGVGLFLLRLLGGISYIYYLKSQHNFTADEYWQGILDKLSKKAGVKKALDLCESALVRSPMVVGYLKPLILFPIGFLNRLNPQEVEAILAHEIAHVLRHDYLFNIVQAVIEALFYYHPAVWWMSANIRAERENCCDDVAIRLIGGNSMNYAKSLVTVQEMQMFSPIFAMGFAGQRRNQLLERIQRILNQSSSKTSVMEKLIATCLIILALVGLNQSVNSRNPFENQLNHSFVGDIGDDYQVNMSNCIGDPLSMSGFWNAKIDGDEVRVQFNHNLKEGQWTSTRKFKKSDFSALPTTESEFKIQREAGSMNLKGKFEGDEGYGKFTFVPSADFRTYLEAQGITNVKDETMVHLFMSDINKAYIAYLKSNGYDKIGKDDLESLAIHGLNREKLEDYLSMFIQSAWKKPSLERLIEFKIHGVSKEFLTSLAESGYKNISEEKILEAKIHGIKSAYIKDLKDVGYTDLSMEQLIEFKIHGVTGAFAQKINSTRKQKATAEDLVEAKIHGIDKLDVGKIQAAGVEPNNDDLRAFAIHGIDAAFIEKMSQAGFGKLNPEQLIAAKIHGLSPEFVKSLASMGFSNLSFSKVIEMKIHGITADYAKAMSEAGYPNLSASKIVEFKIHGITPQYLKEVAAMGFSNLSTNQIVEMKIHGVKPEFVKSFLDGGYKDLPLSKIVEMKIHGVTMDYINGFKEMGFKDISLSKAVELKIHGVTPQYIRTMQGKGYKDLDLNEYIRLKIHGFSNSGGSSK